MASTSKLSLTYQAMKRWDIGEDIRSTWLCCVDENYRHCMTGDWVSEETLQNALKDLNDPNYSDWCIAQNLKLRQIAIEGQALHTALSQNCDHVVKHGGMGAEFGVFTGRTLQYCAELVPETHWYGFDSFEGFEENWSINNGQYSMYREAFSLGGIAPNLEAKNISLVKGYFSDSLPKFASGLTPDQYFSFIHIDCDTFESAECVFKELGNHFVKGTIIVLDEVVGIVGVTDVMKAFYDFVQANNLEFEWLNCGQGPNPFSILERGCVLTHWLFGYKVGMFSAACILR